MAIRVHMHSTEGVPWMRSGSCTFPVTDNVDKHLPEVVIMCLSPAHKALWMRLRSCRGRCTEVLDPRLLFEAIIVCSLTAQKAV